MCTNANFYHQYWPNENEQSTCFCFFAVHVSSVIFLHIPQHVIDGSMTDVTAVIVEPPDGAPQGASGHVLRGRAQLARQRRACRTVLQSSWGSPGKPQPPAVSTQQLPGGCTISCHAMCIVDRRPLTLQSLDLLWVSPRRGVFSLDTRALLALGVQLLLF